MGIRRYYAKCAAKLLIDMTEGAARSNDVAYFLLEDFGIWKSAITLALPQQVLTLANFEPPILRSGDERHLSQFSPKRIE